MNAVPFSIAKARLLTEEANKVAAAFEERLLYETLLPKLQDIITTRANDCKTFVYVNVIVNCVSKNTSSFVPSASPTCFELSVHRDLIGCTERLFSHAKNVWGFKITQSDKGRWVEYYISWES